MALFGGQVSNCVAYLLGEVTNNPRLHIAQTPKPWRKASDPPHMMLWINLLVPKSPNVHIELNHNYKVMCHKKLAEQASKYVRQGMRLLVVSHVFGTRTRVMKDKHGNPKLHAVTGKPYLVHDFEFNASALYEVKPIVNKSNLHDPIMRTDDFLNQEQPTEFIEQFLNSTFTQIPEE